RAFRTKKRKTAPFLCISTSSLPVRTAQLFISASEPGSSDVTSRTCPASMCRSASRVFTIGIGQKSPRQSIVLSATTRISAPLRLAQPSVPLRGTATAKTGHLRYTLRRPAAAPEAGLLQGPRVSRQRCGRTVSGLTALGWEGGRRRLAAARRGQEPIGAGG